MPTPLKLDLRVDDLAMKRPFAITGYVFTAVPAIVVTLTDGEHRGRGEAAGVYYLDDDVPHMVEMIEAVRPQIEAGLSREELQQKLPPCGARNALDCAMWELEAARTGQSVWQLAGIDGPKPLITTLTAGAASPEAMAEDARGYTGAKAIKLKLTGEPDLDIARVEAVRAACPDAWIGVDANQGYGIENLRSVLPAFVRSGVKLVEQPLRRGDEQPLDGFESPIPIAADESVLSCADIPGLVGRFDMINIKLDKCGGLTEALAMVQLARKLDLEVMVGNMGGSSWAMAPAFVVGQYCNVVDLDGPVMLAVDRDPAVEYKDGLIWCDDKVWGRGA